MPGTNNTGVEQESRIMVAIPCLNTASRIADVVQKALRHADEVVVIDDGSVDNTVEVARSAGARVVSHQGNQGYGRALKSCFEAAQESKCDVLVIIDGDGQHDANEIPVLLEPALRKEAKLIIGSRLVSANGNIPSYRKVGIGIITWLFNFGSGQKCRDAQSGFRAYDRDAYQCLVPSEKGMSASIEILEKARRQGLTLKEVPISCRYFDSNITRGAISHGLSVALSVVRIRLKNLAGGNNGST